MTQIDNMHILAPTNLKLKQYYEKIISFKTNGFFNVLRNV